MNNKDTEAPERDQLVKKFAYEYVRFNHDPNHCYLVTDVTDDCMLEIEGMSGQFAPSCFNLAPQPKQEPTVGADGRYCAHHDDDPAHTEECYEVEYARVDPPAAPTVSNLMAMEDEDIARTQELLNALTDCDSVLSYIYYRESARLTTATQEQLYEAMSKVQRLTRKRKV